MFSLVESTHVAHSDCEDFFHKIQGVSEITEFPYIRCMR